MLEIMLGYGFLYKFLLFILKSALISGKRKKHTIGKRKKGKV
jgi:hypothetical protein